MNSIPLEILGHVHADFGQKFGTPRQGALAPHSRASLELAPKWRGRGLFDGLEGFSHAWLVTFLHLSENTRARGKVHPPRLGGKKVGILASRSPHRPNNVGLTLARVLAVEGDRLRLAEVDVVSGTPVLDVKPYLAAADRPAEFHEGWTAKLEPRTECATAWHPRAEADLARLHAEPGRVRVLLTEMLALDPRPPAYLGRERARFAVFVAGLNVILNYDRNVFTVTAVEPAP